MKKLFVLPILMVVAISLGANGAQTFLANWDDPAGDPFGIDVMPSGQPDYPAGPYPNNTSSAEGVLGNGYVELRPEDGEARQNALWMRIAMADSWGSDGFTIKFWYNPAARATYAGDPVYGQFWYYEDYKPGQPQPFLIGSYDNDSIDFSMKLGGDSWSVSKFATMTAGTWNQIAYVVDLVNDTVMIYLNGQPIGSAASLPATHTSWDPDTMTNTWPDGIFVIGGDRTSGKPTSIVAEGGYDKFEMYDVALSDQQVLANYNEGRVIPEPSLALLLLAAMGIVARKK